MAHKISRLYDGAINTALGEILRREREARDINRVQLAHRLWSDLPDGGSPQTLANWEYGIRAMSVERLVEFCEALGLHASDVLTEAIERAPIVRMSFNVDLRAISEDERRVLKRLREWAQGKLSRHSDAIVRLDPNQVEDFAMLLGMDKAKFIGYLKEFKPASY